MNKIINSIAYVFEAFEEHERRSNTYNRYAAQLPSTSKDFNTWRSAHEDFNRPQRFRAFLSGRPELVDALVYSIMYDESTKEGFEKVAYAVFETVKNRLSVNGSIKV